MLKLRRVAFWVLLIFILTMGLMGCGKSTTQPTSSEGKEKLKVAFIYIGPVGDAGWTYAHEQGRKYLEQHVPDIETKIVEKVPEVDGEKVATQLVQEGYKVIFATSFGYMDGIINVAKKYPNIIFLHCSGYKTAPNVGTYFGRMYQARYLSGIVAGKMTKTNKIGYVAAFPIPEVVRGINAFTLGVRAVNPKATVNVVWTNTWLNPALEKDAAKSLLEQGCDIITQHQDSPGPMQAAEEKGAYGIGYNSDMSKYAPKAFLTAPVWNWGPYYVKVINEIKEGKWKSSQYWGPMSDGVVGLAPFSKAVPEDVRKLVEEKKQLIVSGKWDVFTGPIKDQKGEIRVKDGERMTDQAMLSFDWFVEGVQGTIPAKK
ncbi:MAG TPA: BMP family ABC transporter substrate-binding protein [Syntrophomonadaceae bacterium]|nr:BMP family ABC transporter substrate-binding protein [Syntrophomonadaceae bacterium]